MNAKVRPSVCIRVSVLALPATAAAVSALSGGFWRLVRRGETLASIVNKYGAR